MARRDDPERDAFGRPVAGRAATPERASTPGSGTWSAPGRDAPRTGSGSWSTPEQGADAATGPGAPPSSTGDPAPASRARPDAGTTGRTRLSDEPFHTASNPEATAALLFGLGSVFLLPFLLSIPAIVFARRARRTARDLDGRPGWTAATWGLWMGWFTLAWPAAIVLLSLVGATAGVLS